MRKVEEGREVEVISSSGKKFQGELILIKDDVGYEDLWNEL